VISAVMLAFGSSLMGLPRSSNLRIAPDRYAGHWLTGLIERTARDRARGHHLEVEIVDTLARIPDGSSVVIHVLGFFPSVFLMFSLKLLTGSL
jgi:hypothetical protein